jgi:predicted Rossmann-fold nucleotide-binding protein
VGSDFWQGLMSWIEEVVQQEQKNISPEDLDIITVVNTAQEAVDVINKFYSKYLLSPNF